MDRQMTAVQLYVCMLLECFNDPFQILFEQPQQIVVVNVPRGDEKKLIGFVVDQMAGHEVGILRYYHSLVEQGNLVDRLIRCTVLQREI
jgi:hypothetical protein